VTPVPLLNGDGVTVGKASLAPAIADQPIKQHLIHETVVAELAARRAGTHSTRNRAAVRGGGSKPWRQKGTGRARQGSTRAPQWAGGGIVFGPTPRSYGGKVNRKVRQQAFRAALRAHADRGSAALMDPAGWEAPSTKRAVEYLRQAPDGLAVRPLLVVVEDLDSVEARSFRNLAGVHVLAGDELETVDAVAAKAILVERSVWERLAGEPSEVEAVTPKPKPAPKPKPKPRAKPKPAPAPEEAAAEEEAEAPEAAVEAEAEAEAPEAVEEAPKPRRSRARKAPAAEEPEAAEVPEAAEEPAAEPEPEEPAAEEAEEATADDAAEPDAAEPADEEARS
jgi:large subunit ribosomal protein L4